MNIIAESTTGTFVITGTGNAEATSIIDDLRREVESGRTRWFAVVGAGVPTPNVQNAERTASTHLDRSPPPCECEHGEHFGEGTLTVHDYRKVPAGDSVARYIGPVCDPCARDHMAGYIL